MVIECPSHGPCRVDLTAMKLTFVLPNLLLYGGIKSTIAMAEAMRHRGHDVTIVSPVVPGRDGLGWTNLRRTGVQLVRAFQNAAGRPRWFDFGGSILRPPWLAERFLPEADILVLTWWADVVALKDCDPSRGIAVHFARSFEIWGGPPDKVRASYLAGLPIVVTSASLKRTLATELGVDPVAIIPNGLDPVFFDPEQPPGPRPTAGHESPRVGVLYRLQDWKRMDDAFDAIERCDAPLRLVIFGERIKDADRRRLANFGQVEFHHLPAGTQLRDVYRSLDVFLFTSDETEAFGNPPFEALACGPAVVTTRVGAIPEYLRHDVHARLCQPGDVSCLAANLRELLEQPEERERLARAGREVARRLDWSHAAALFEETVTAIMRQPHQT